MTPDSELSSDHRLKGVTRFLSAWGPEILLLVVTTAVGFYAGGRWVDPTGDPGLWWSVSSRLAEGERYYRDIPLQFGPLSPYLLAAGVRIFGFSVPFVLLVNWIPAILAGLLLLVLSRRLLSGFERVAMLGLLLGIALFAPGKGRLVYPYSPAAVHALCLALGAFLIALRKAGARAVPWPGLLAGLAFAAKQEIGLAALVAVLVFEAFAPQRGRRLLMTVAGFLLAVAPAAVFALSSAPLESLRNESHLWPLTLQLPTEWSRLYAGVAGMSSPRWVARLLESLRGALFYGSIVCMVAAALRHRLRVRPFAGPALVFIFASFVGLLHGRWLPDRWSAVSLSMLASLVVVLVGLLDRRVQGRPLIVAFGVFAALLSARTAFSRDLGSPYSGVAHFSTALSWALLLLVLLPRRLTRSKESRKIPRRVWAAVLFLLGWGAAYMGIRSLANPDRVAIASRVGRFWVTPRQGGLFTAILREIRPGERVALLPETNGVDVITGARPALRYVILMPGTLDAEVERRIQLEFETQPPAAIFVFERPTAEYGLRPLGIGYGREIMSWIEARHRVVARTPAGSILRPAK